VNLFATSTGQQFADTIIKESFPWLLRAIDEATRKVYRSLWDSVLMPFLSLYWSRILVVLILLLLFAYLKAMTTKRWGLFGSLLYSYLYFGVLFLIGCIFGPETFANNYFKIFLAILYVVCFALTGKILRDTGAKRY